MVFSFIANVLGMSQIKDVTTLSSGRDTGFDEGVGKENPVIDMVAVQNGVDTGLRKRANDRSRQLPSDAHYNMSDTSSKETTNVKVNGCISMPMASLPKENYNLNENKHE